MARDDGVPAELREAIRVVVEPSKAEYDWHDDLTAVAEERVDVVLSAIEAAGYRIVPPEAGAMCCVGGECWAHDGSEWAGWFEELLHPGDLGGTS